MDAGTLIVTNNGAIPDGSSLTVGAGGVFIFDPMVPRRRRLSFGRAAVPGGR